MVSRPFVNVALLACLAAFLGAPACSGTPAPERSGRPAVVAALYPLAWAARAVAGSRAEVTDLTPPGAEPHDIELTASQVEALTRASLVLYVGEGFQPAVQDALGEIQGNKIDVLELAQGFPGGDTPSNGKSHAQPHRAGDPHVWLDPSAMQSIVLRTGQELAHLDPANAPNYLARAGHAATALRRLDHAYRVALSGCRSRSFVTGHEAFGYLARRYGLRQVTVSGLDPEAEPSPQSLVRAVRYLRAHGADVVFYERSGNRRLAATVAEEAGARTLVLDAMEQGPPGGYIAAMRRNLASLREGLACK
ncbi:MAG TPA: metal ABC transporter substrate-binding protein [Actinomycetota bacterium]|jgi:zinc transport system substrate-binding protein|nr:metal ABC transporter substrate-binding protein [Actinomycetota bacterium]